MQQWPFAQRMVKDNTKDQISNIDLRMSRRGAQSTSTALNWRRGLFRVWLVISAAWIMAWAIWFILSALAQALNATVIPIVFFGPPIALFICGLATRWAIRGFSSDQKGGQTRSAIRW